MKYYSLHRYGSIAAFVFLSFVLHAKPDNSTNAFTKSLSFIENKGQITDQYGKHRNDIDYKLDGGNVIMFVGDGQIHYQWYQSNKKEKSKNENGLQRDSKSPSGDLGVYRMDVILLGANKNAELIKEGLLDDHENYYLPQCPDGVTAHRYSKITYKNVYPNIDWEIESPLPSPKGEASSQACKYNFIVHPGGDYRNIKIQYNGATAIALKDGALMATTPMGSIIENVPYTYDAETKKEIKSNFILNNNILSYNISFPLGEGRDGAAFIIDPVLRWATYYGGNGDDIVYKPVTDTAGNVYIAGQTNSSNNIATTGAHQAGISGNIDGFVAKFDINGVRQWGTYYGSANEDEFFGVAVNLAGTAVYAAGVTNGGTGLATTGSHQPFLYSGGSSGLIVSFNSSGQRQWATYFGDSTFISGIDCSNAGDLYICGRANTQTPHITTSGTHQPLPAGDLDGFVAKFNAAGTRQWCTLYGGTSGDDLNAIAADNLGNVYVAGSTTSNNGIASTGAYQTVASDPNESFLAKFDNTGQRTWGTYFGGIGNDIPSSLVYDNAGYVYIAGNTASLNGIATTGAFQGTGNSLIGAGFIAQFSTSGARNWGTYYRIGGIRPNLGIDPKHKLLVTTLGSPGAATSGALKTTPSGSVDLLFSIFNAAGGREYATYFGGDNLDVYTASTLVFRWGGISCSKGKVYIVDHTNSTTGLATPGAHQTTYGGKTSSNPNFTGDAYIVQFDLDTMVFIIQPYTDTLLCIGDSIHIHYGVSQTFRSGNTFTLQLSNASGSFASPTTLATVTGSVGGTFNTVMPVVTAGTGYRLRIIASAPADTSSDNGIDIKVRPNPTTPTAAANTPICAGQTLNLSSSNSSTGVVWSWAGPNSFTAATQNASIPNVQTNATGDYIVTANLNGCKRKDTVSVTVSPSPAKPNATSNSPICSGQTLNLFATSTTGGVSWSWVGPGGFNTSAQNPTIPNAQTANAGSYVVTATLGNCSSADTEVVVINQGPAINIYPSPNDTICQGGSVTLVAVPISAGTGPTFQWYKNSNPIGGATNTSYSTTPNNGDVYYCQMTPGTGTSCTGAVSSNSITMTVLPVTTPSVSISGPAGAQDPYNLLTFHATGTGGGSSPKYQWLRSGHQLIQGATGDTWSTQGLYLSQHDTICVILTSSDICAVPKSDTACMAVNILTGVEDINKNTTIQLYPNPNDGRFTIDAKGIGSKEVTIEIVNAVGQTVHTQKASTAKGILHETISTTNLAAGMYLLKLNDGDAVATLRLVVRY